MLTAHEYPFGNGRLFAQKIIPRVRQILLVLKFIYLWIFKQSQDGIIVTERNTYFICQTNVCTANQNFVILCKLIIHKLELRRWPAT